MIFFLLPFKALGRAALSAVLVLALAGYGQAEPGSSFSFLEGYGFREVPLADSLVATGPKVKQEEAAAPVWKRRWDEARRLVASDELSQAVLRYRELLGEKEIGEARWEMATVLLRLDRGGEAVNDLESLCEEFPDRSRYWQALAVSNLALGRYPAAAAAFRRLNAVQSDSTSAVAGEIYALLAGGDRKEALAPLGVLSQLEPGRADIREALATLAFEVGEYETASPQLNELCKRSNCSPKLLKMAAIVSEAMKSPTQAAAYWQRYAVLRPNDLEVRQWLADYYRKQGQFQQALPHLEALRRGRSDDAIAVKRLGLGYLEGHDYAKADQNLTEYLQRHPEDKEAAKALIGARQPLGDTAKTINALEGYFALEPQPDQDSLETAARLYGSIGDHNKAVSVLRRLLEAKPGDQGIMTDLGNHLEAAGRKEEALTVWRQLTGRSATAAEAWRHIAGLEQQLGRQQPLFAALAKLHEVEPTDNDVSLKLVAHYAARGAVDWGLAVIADMERYGSPVPDELYLWRAQLRGAQHDYHAALADAERFLTLRPDDQAARRLAMTAAGRLGDAATVLSHYQAASKGSEEDSVDLLLAAAQAFADCRAETAARDLLQRVVVGKEAVFAQKKQAYAGLAESFARDGLRYEAEEWLRVGLAATGDRLFFLPRLIDLALAQRQVTDAEEWLTALHPLMLGSSNRLALLEAAVLTGRGELRKARQILTRVEKDWAKPGVSSENAAKTESADAIPDRLRLAALWLDVGKPQRAVAQGQWVVALDPENLEAQVLLEKAAANTVQSSSGQVKLSGLRFDQLCDLAQLYQRYGMPARMAGAAEQALVQRPDSVKAGLLLAEAFAGQARIDAALARMKQLAAANPQDPSLDVRIAELEFQQGATTVAAPLVSPHPEQPQANLVLLRARMLWRQNEWDAALKVYHDFLTPRIAERLRNVGLEMATTLPERARRRSLWEVVTWDPGPDQDADFADRVMRPAMAISFLDHGDEEFALAAARVTARYRWQAQFAMEYAARQSVVRREYTIARKQYEALLARYPQQRLLLFDLAGMYSALGSLGEEAAAYGALKAAGIEFPELDEAMSRNRLKQQPKAAVTGGYQKEAGRLGYVDREKNWRGLSFWKSFSPLHDGEMTVERITYRAGSAGEVVRASRATGSYSAGLLHGLTASGMAGVQGQERTDRQAFVAHAAIVGKVGDGLTGSLSFVRDVVDDTTASLERNILRQDLQGGITLEPLPRLAVGGGYLARDYSDNNWTTGYDFWTSYLLFAEPTFLRLKYSYEFKESREGAIAGGILEEDGFAANDHPYWAPKNYWLNQIGLFFKHSLADEPLDREAPRYYTLEYAVGHDADGYATQTAKAAVFAECNANFLVEAGTELTTSQAFRRQEYRVGVSYRW